MGGRRRPTNDDIISKLPTNIKETILCYLPLQDAVRTSILSRDWRYCWTNIPKLVFDENLWNKLTARQLYFTEKHLVHVIYQVVLIHQGPILGFTLCVSSLEGCCEIDQLILFLSRKNVETLVLHVGDEYKLPSSFFTYSKLKDLYLESCVFNPPTSFTGFSQLISAKFIDVTISAEILESFTSSCPLLETLTVTTPSSFESFTIVAPKLKCLTIYSYVKSILFKNAPCLTDVTVWWYGKLTPEKNMQRGRSNLKEMFVHLPRLKKLNLDYFTVQLLDAGSTLKKNLPTTSINLTFLRLYKICFGKLDELSIIIWLIKASPKLQNLEIKIYKESSTVSTSVIEFLEEQSYHDFSLDDLRLVKICYPSGIEPEMEFIKLLLAKSPLLEKLFITYRPEKLCDKGLEMLKTLSCFERASPKARVIFDEQRPENAN